MIESQYIWQDCTTIRHTHPLNHNITNQVVMQLNAQLHISKYDRYVNLETAVAPLVTSFTAVSRIINSTHTFHRAVVRRRWHRIHGRQLQHSQNRQCDDHVVLNNAVNTRPVGS